MEPLAFTFRRNVSPADMEIVRDIVVSTGFFYDFEVPVAVELVEEHLDHGLDSGYHFIFVEETHRAIREAGGRLCIAETSTIEKYTPTRNFYLSMGYELESVINDFYKIGDGKATFIKRF
jgi:hypothetical protein